MNAPGLTMEGVVLYAQYAGKVTMTKDSKVKKCALCSPTKNSGFSLCSDCFSAWPKGITLDEYLAKPYNPVPRKCPDPQALVIRQARYKPRYTI